MIKIYELLTQNTTFVRELENLTTKEKFFILSFGDIVIFMQNIDKLKIYYLKKDDYTEFMKETEVQEETLDKLLSFYYDKVLFYHKLKNYSKSKAPEETTVQDTEESNLIGQGLVSASEADIVNTKSGIHTKENKCKWPTGIIHTSPSATPTKQGIKFTFLVRTYPGSAEKFEFFRKSYPMTEAGLVLGRFELDTHIRDNNINRVLFFSDKDYNFIKDFGPFNFIKMTRFSSIMDYKKFINTKIDYYKSKALEIKEISSLYKLDTHAR